MGHLDGEIIGVSAYVQRTSCFDASRRFPDINVDSVRSLEMEPFFVINLAITKHSRNQKLLQQYSLDTLKVPGENYGTALQVRFNQYYKQIVKDFPEIELFSPEYISFCGYQTSCEQLALVFDSLQQQSFFQTGKKRYALPALSDSQQLFTFSPYYDEYGRGMTISSVRIYKSKTLKLTIGHLETGHELGMGMITHDPKKTKNEEGFELIFYKEEKPDFPFSNIETAAYQEPLLHHGFGYDLFVVN